ncbi:hypothetical protein, partial [Mycobacteroides salmoniphilum]|uniref:hypothetical protein n=1 Tax=Mycobacteroides salmoniphilum TaxID=404941 RepID=UPI001AD80093
LGSPARWGFMDSIGRGQRARRVTVADWAVVIQCVPGAPPNPSRERFPAGVEAALLRRRAPTATSE